MADRVPAGQILGDGTRLLKQGAGPAIFAAICLTALLAPVLSWADGLGETPKGVILYNGIGFLQTAFFRSLMLHHFTGAFGGAPQPWHRTIPHAFASLLPVILVLAIAQCFIILGLLVLILPGLMLLGALSLVDLVAIKERCYWSYPYFRSARLLKGRIALMFCMQLAALTTAIFLAVVVLLLVDSVTDWAVLTEFLVSLAILIPFSALVPYKVVVYEAALREQ